MNDVLEAGMAQADGSTDAAQSAEAGNAAESASKETAGTPSSGSGAEKGNVPDSAEGDEVCVVGVFDTYQEGQHVYYTLRDAQLV